MTPTALKIIKKIIIRLLAGIAFFILGLTAMVCIMSAIVYKDNWAFLVGMLLLVITVPSFSVLVWKEVNRYAEKFW